MKFKLYTLADVTESGTRKGADTRAVGQQTNYDTLIQVIGLRANPIPVTLKMHNESITKLNFGSKYKGKHNYWTFEFDIFHDFGHSIDMLKEDFNLVPFISNLTDTVKFDNSIFYSQDSSLCNIYFEQIDK